MCRGCSPVLNSAIYSYENYANLDAGSELKTKLMGKSLLTTFNATFSKQFSCLYLSYTWTWKSSFFIPHCQQIT